MSSCSRHRTSRRSQTRDSSTKPFFFSIVHAGDHVAARAFARVTAHAALIGAPEIVAATVVRLEDDPALRRVQLHGELHVIIDAAAGPPWT
jgi:hypothetical protein